MDEQYGKVTTESCLVVVYVLTKQPISPLMLAQYSVVLEE